MIGKTLSHYEIVEEIGKGGMGVVYRARDTALDRDVAVKVLAEKVAGSQERISRFEREAKAIAKLSHSNILGIFDFGSHEGITYAVTELLEGESLRQALNREGSLPVERALSIARAAAAGLAAAHAKKTIHRDIKPGNIFLTADGGVKILDFGLARSEAESMIATIAPEEESPGLTTPGVILGTMGYMSPEQARGQPATPASDVFSLGCALYEMLTGVGPFRRETETDTLSAVLKEEPPPLDIAEQQIPRKLERVLWKALEKNSDKRYASGVELEQALAEVEAELAPSPLAVRSLLKMMMRPAVLVPTLIVLLAVGVIAGRWLHHQSRVRWAREQVIPEVRRLVEGSWGEIEDQTDAFELAKEARRYLPDDPDLTVLLERCSAPYSVRTTPPGATVYTKRYGSPDNDWEILGVSPIEDRLMPFSHFRWKLEKEGYATVIAEDGTWRLEQVSRRRELSRTLDRDGELPVGMVRVPRAPAPPNVVAAAGLSGTTEPVYADSFFIDRYEVTNRQFKEFVDRGGYQTRQYWKYQFVKGGKTLSWEQAMSEFVDMTGRPGPATWQGGLYPDGKADFPVSGVSWYEAAAYAEFSGKALPTFWHWSWAAGLFRGVDTVFLNSHIIKLSNLRGDGPVAVGSMGSLNTFGTYDMAGNVREWCWNEAPKGRCIRGGAWDDVAYMFQLVSQAPPFDRSSKNGFRCARYLEEGPLLEFTRRPYRGFSEEPPDLYSVEPVSDSVFEVYRDQFSYDMVELDPVVEDREESSSDWMVERVTFAAAYDNDRVIAYLFLPRNVPPPYQTVIFFPVGPARSNLPSSGNLSVGAFDFLVKDGRAVVHPIYYGTYERNPEAPDFGIPNPANAHAFTQLRIRRIKDLKRTIDYLETRNDIDADRIAFYGDSWGARHGPIAGAVEDRLRVHIWWIGGIRDGAARPEAHAITYVPRVTAPTLMLNGRYDAWFPFEETVKPMFDLLGTPAEHKRLMVYETDHYVPRNELIKENLAWLDKYLGPVERAGK